MGTLIAKAYPTSLLAKAADHVYVECGTGKKAWGCWGGKTDGRELRTGTGSTKRADAIAQPDERAGIKCYLVNGVCHQSANRILLPASITASAARGYWISEALFGTYGRVGTWPCKAPFRQHANVTGDFAVCVRPEARSARARATRRGVAPALTAEQRLEWQYVQGVLRLYGTASRTLRARSVAPADARQFHQALFMHMAEFQLGPMLNRQLATRLRRVHTKTEKARGKLQSALSAKEMPMGEYVRAFNRQTIAFQEEMANLMTREQYVSMFDLKRGVTVLLADPEIVRKAYGR